MAKKVLTYNLSEPLSGATTMKVDIDPGDGNLMVDGLTGGEPVLANGELQYLESQGQPTSAISTQSGQTTLTLKSSGKGQPWFRLPWAACNGATEWHIHLNPSVSFDIDAHSGGGNVRLNLDGMTVTRVTAETGGGNMEVTLPNNMTGSCVVSAKTGAGNVVVHLPAGIAARIHATSGLGKVIIDPRCFNKIDNTTYQSPDYDLAVNKVDITAGSGAGNVSVVEKIAQHEAAETRI